MGAGLLVTTSTNAGRKTVRFARDVSTLFCGGFVPRKGQRLGEVIPEREGVDVVLIRERNKEPYELSIGRTGEGPTYVFRIGSYASGGAEEGYPEIVVEGFKTELGLRVEAYIKSVFSLVPEYKYRNVVTFCNSMDFIFVRRYRYAIGEEGVRLSELGPRFTLKLRQIRRGMFGKEVEWERKSWGKREVYL